MNKKVLLSLAIVAVVAIVATAGTIAYFTDTETSTGNTFTAGTIDLTIDSECTYNGSSTAAGCGNWELKNLDPTADKFFNFGDIKPGDQGENTISLHVETNQAHVCVAFGNVSDDENTCVEPEIGDEPNCVEGDNNGELGENLWFFAWADDGDNIWEYGETPLFNNEGNIGQASDVLGGKIYSLQTVDPGETKYVGLAWCAGTMTATTEGQVNTITCSGADMNNEAQSDSFSADIAFHAIQTRNNEEFTCADWYPDMPEFDI